MTRPEHHGRRLARNAMSPPQQHNGQTTSSPQREVFESRLDIGVHELIAQQAVRFPDAIAVVCGDELLTYRDLEQRANRLANYLCVLGVGPETIVGLALEASLDAIVGMLGILKARWRRTFRWILAIRATASRSCWPMRIPRWCFVQR